MLGGGASSGTRPSRPAVRRQDAFVQQAHALRATRSSTTAGELARRTGSKPLLGLFAPTNLDLEWVGPTPDARRHRTDARVQANAARPATQPHLVDMTNKALSILDQQTKRSKKGFFLQVEGASIDKQDHAANPCGQIGETVAFDAAVKAALTYQKYHRDTLVVVTADHGHTSQIVETGSTTPGVTATLTTADGADDDDQLRDGGAARLASSTPARRCGSQPRVRRPPTCSGVTDQTDLFFTMRRALGLN